METKALLINQPKTTDKRWLVSSNYDLVNKTITSVLPYFIPVAYDTIHETLDTSHFGTWELTKVGSSEPNNVKGFNSEAEKTVIAFQDETVTDGSTETYATAVKVFDEINPKKETPYMCFLPWAFFMPKESPQDKV